MFIGASACNQPLNNWDTSSVTTMRYTLNGARAFNQPLNKLDTSSLTDIQQMFHSASVFDQPLNKRDVFEHVPHIPFCQRIRPEPLCVGC